MVDLPTIPSIDNYKGIIATVAALILVPIVALASYYLWSDWLIPTICVGAIGGLAHELIQSQGKYMLPATDEKGNLSLGGLVGLIEGGIAGIILLQGQTIPIADPHSVLISAFLAGLALKGVSDSVVNHVPTADEKVAAADKAKKDAEKIAESRKAIANAKIETAECESAAAKADKIADYNQRIKLANLKKTVFINEKEAAAIKDP
jgi:hypothetical protein